MTDNQHYGTAPEEVGTFDLDWHEYMHYMYLPVCIDSSGPRLPERLEFLREMLHHCLIMESQQAMSSGVPMRRNVYVCARRGFATPGNPLNRPGWHSDGFGTDDVNYIWTDRFPTLFAEQEFHDISTDHVRSIEQFTEQIGESPKLTIYRDRTLLRLTPSVIHAAPEIPTPGGERGFIKISFSNAIYNLRGNSHNHLFDYDWTMHDRAALRNDPAYAGGDAGPQEPSDVG